LDLAMVSLIKEDLSQQEMQEETIMAKIMMARSKQISRNRKKLPCKDLSRHLSRLELKKRPEKRLNMIGSLRKRLRKVSNLSRKPILWPSD
jgi:hypothetical protein